MSQRLSEEEIAKRIQCPAALVEPPPFMGPAAEWRRYTDDLRRSLPNDWQTPEALEGAQRHIDFLEEYERRNSGGAQ